MRFFWRMAAACACLATLAARVDGGELYRFTSTVDLVQGASSIPGLQFAAGQSVTGTFRYAPELGLLLGSGREYWAAFSELKVEIDLGSSVCRVVAPDWGEGFMGGRPLNHIYTYDNVPLAGGGWSDSFGLVHNNRNLGAPGVPSGPGDPAGLWGNFFPAYFVAEWRTETVAAQSALPTFLTDNVLPAGLNELFPRSANDHWSLRFDGLVGSGSAGQSFTLMGRMATLETVPEPGGAALACVAGAIAFAARRGFV
jgi:hypothetical protein